MANISLMKVVALGGLGTNLGMAAVGGCAAVNPT